MRIKDLRAFVGTREFVLHSNTPPTAVWKACGMAPRSTAGLLWAWPGGAMPYATHAELEIWAASAGLEVRLMNKVPSTGVYEEVH